MQAIPQWAKPNFPHRPCTRAGISSPEISTQAEFGVGECPARTSLTSVECQAAAVQFGKPFDRVDSWDSQPSGCFATNGYSNTHYFNKHEGDGNVL